MFLYFLVLYMLLGLVIGSFLNVCIYRIPAGESIVYGSSHCTACGGKIKPYDLIPVVSFLLLRGKCRSCGEKIPPRYPVIELLNAVLYLLVYLRFGIGLQSVLYCLAASCLVVIAMIDLDTKEIPNGPLIVLLILAVPSLFLPDMPFWHRLIGFAAASLPLLIISLATHEGIGFGDVKLMAAAGLLIGFANVLLALFIGCVTAGIAAGALLILKKAGRRTEMPLAPFLSLGLIVSALYGSVLTGWYLSLF